MKHPLIETLQNYFDSETNDLVSAKVKEHLQECDRCSVIVSQMAQVDIAFSQSQKRDLSVTTREKIMSLAKPQLAQKREKLSHQKEREKKIIERKENIKVKVKTYRHSLLRELRAPILQATALLIICGVFTEFSRTSIKKSKRKIIDNSVHVYLSNQNTEVNK